MSPSVLSPFGNLLLSGGDVCIGTVSRVSAVLQDAKGRVSVGRARAWGPRAARDLSSELMLSAQGRRFHGGWVRAWRGAPLAAASASPLRPDQSFQSGPSLPASRCE